MNCLIWGYYYATKREVSMPSRTPEESGVITWPNSDPGNEHVTRRPLRRVSHCLHVIRLIVFFTIWENHYSFWD